MKFVEIWSAMMTVALAHQENPVMRIGGTMTAIHNHGKSMSKQPKKIVEHIPQLHHEPHTVAQDLDHLTWTRMSSQHAKRRFASKAPVAVSM